MISTLRIRSRVCFLPLFGLGSTDKIENVTKTEKEADRSYLEKQTGWERLKEMFQINEFGTLSNEVKSILQVAAMSTFIGAIYGGVINSRQAYLEFMRSNEATAFANHLEAKKKLQDAVTLSFGKGAFKWGWRLTLFSTSFITISSVIQTYRGEYGITEYILAGAFSGFLYKFNMGPRGWIVGGGLGSVLGLICGATTIGILQIAGISMKEARYWQNRIYDQRSQYFNQQVADYIQQEEFAVIKLHNEEVGEKGKNIENIESESEQIKK